MKKTFIISGLLLVFLSIFLVLPIDVLAVTSFDQGLNKTAGETGHKALTKWSDPENLPQMIGRAIGIILSFVGIVFLALMIYGGYIWMMARGNEQEIEKAKKIIQNSIIGIAIILVAYAITYMLASLWEKI